MAPIINSLGGASARAFGFRGAGGIAIPQGLIVPLASSTIPSGWSAFSDADTRMIVGAGSTYAAGATGGNTSISGYTSATGSAGNHNHRGGDSCHNGGGTTGYAGNNSEGGHTHSVTVSTVNNCIDVYKDFRLIKADTGSMTKLPANAILLGASSLSDIDNIETSTDRLLRANSTYGSTGGSGNHSGTSGTSTSAGTHGHTDGGYNNTCGTSKSSGNTQGAHTHSFTSAVTLDTKRIYLSMWTKASEEFDLQDQGIAMWESATPPDGWNICDGTNGTPDCRDYFLWCGDTGNQGTTSGNNSANYAATLATTSGTSHSHLTGSSCNTSLSGLGHTTRSWDHGHTANSSATILQNYYSLYFIQLAA